MQYFIDLPFGAYLTLEIDADEAIMALDRWTDKVQDQDALFEGIAKYMREALGRRFKEGGPGWVPLKPSTVATKEMLGLPPVGKNGKILPRLQQVGAVEPAHSILIATGALRDSYRRKGAKGHIEDIDVGQGTVEVGSSLPHAAFHQQGTSAYQILAKGGALRFMGSNGQTIIRKSVQHPGLPARPVGLTPVDARHIEHLVKEHLEGQG